MNFLIFRDFSRIFLNLTEFNLIYVKLNSLIYPVLMRQMMWHERKNRLTWQHLRPPHVTHVYMSRVFECACLSARVCVCAHVCARVCD